MTVEEEFKELLSKVLGFEIANLELQSKLIDGLFVDRIDLIETSFEVEERFGVEIDNEELSEIFKTVQSAVDWITKNKL